jgi:SOS response regulatory protein OraA/RecX
MGEVGREAFAAAEKAALRLVARAEQSQNGLLRKLRARGWSLAAAREAVSRLTESKLVDDGRFARLWADARLIRKIHSPRDLMTQLQSRGIARQTAKEAVQNAVAAYGEEKLAAAYLENNPKKETSSALKAKLRAEGFSPDTVAALFDN